MEYTSKFHDLRAEAGFLDRLLPRRTRPENSEKRFKLIPGKARDHLRKHYKHFLGRIDFTALPDQDFEAVAIRNVSGRLL